MQQKRVDGWQNLVSLLGTKYDKKMHMKYKLGFLDKTVLNELYRGDGFARKIVNLPVHNMLREWLKVDGDTENQYQRIYKRIGLKKAIRSYLQWDRLYGGSVMIAGLDDGRKFHEPVNYAALKGIRFLKVYDKWKVDINDNYYNDNINDPNYGNIEYYDITPVQGSPFVVHKSRISILNGEDSGDSFQHVNTGWGDSVLQSCYENIRALSNIYSNVESIISDFVTQVMKIDNLQQLIASGREEIVKRRMEIIDMTKSVINTIFIDTKEDFEKKTSATSGLDKLIQEYCIALSSTSNIPTTLLMGRSPAGMNATGESDLTAFYDWISSLQEEKILPTMEWINELILRSSEYEVDVKEPMVVFNPLWQPTEEEIVKSRKTQAEIDAMYIDRAVLTSQEIRTSRFGGVVYSYDTSIEGDIEPDDREPIDDIEPDDTTTIDDEE